MSAAIRSQTTMTARKPPRCGHLVSRSVLVVVLAATGGLHAGCGSSSSNSDAAVPGTGGRGIAASGGSGGRIATNDASVTSTGGRSATGGSGGGSASAVALGKSCNNDFDCGQPFVCLRAAGNDILGQAGFPGGYCSFRCSEATDARCTAMGGTCNNIGPSAEPTYYCYEGCTVGSSLTSKCHGRDDVGCFGPSQGPGVCEPMCSSDIECPVGRKCLFNICVNSALNITGDALGSFCNAEAAEDTCLNQCFGITGEGPTFCSTFCVLGSPTACNFVEKSVSLVGSHGVCAPFDATDQAGDAGYCLQQCDTAMECRNQTDKNLVCDTSVVELGHGFCAWTP